MPALSLWSRFKRSLIRTEKEVAFFKGLTVVGLVGTIITAYFQAVGTYEDQISAQYKDDYSGAAATFAEAANVLTPAITLQQELYKSYKEAIEKNKDGDDQAFLTQSARSLYQQYVDRRQFLRQNIQALARKIEMQIDRPSNRHRNVATDTSIGADPLTPSLLGVYNFDCDRKDNIPDATSLATLKAVQIKGQPGSADLNLDWRSVKHQIIALQYCFETTHTAIEASRQWASRSSVDPERKTSFRNHVDNIHQSLDEQVDRLNALMQLSMRRIEEIRLKYEPNGFWCHLPVFREGCWLIGWRRGY
jgi:hypothetical protein